MPLIATLLVLSQKYYWNLGKAYEAYSESWPVKMGLTRCPETSVNNYHTTPCNYPDDHRFHLQFIFISAQRG
jgi:hypothetical protein